MSRSPNSPCPICHNFFTSCIFFCSLLCWVPPERDSISLSTRHQPYSVASNVGYAAACVLTTQRKRMAQPWAVLTLSLWVAGQKSCTYAVGHLLTCETSKHPPSLLQSFPPKSSCHVLPIHILSWAPQVLPWKKGRCHTIHSLCLNKSTVALFLWSLKHISNLENCCKTSSLPCDLIFKGTELIPRRRWKCCLWSRGLCLRRIRIPLQLIFTDCVHESRQPCGEQVKMALVLWVCPGGTDPQLPAHRLGFSVNVLGRGAGIFSFNKLNLPVSPPASYCFTVTMLRSFL